MSLPAGTGKTLLGTLLAHRLGCEFILDDWDPLSGVQPGALHLTNVDLCTDHPSAEPTPPAQDLPELLCQCIGLLMACEDVFRRDLDNHSAQGLPHTIDHELRTNLVAGCAEWLPQARQAHQRLQADAQAIAALRREVAP